MVEEERKYEADAPFSLPDLTRCLPKGGRLLTLAPVTMRAVYFDTADLRLARAGVSLRHRSSSGLSPAAGAAGAAASVDVTAGAEPELPWTVKLPTGSPGARHEINRAAIHATSVRTAAAIPPDLVALVTVFTRGAPLEPTVTLRTTRARYELRDRSGDPLAEVADDAVSVLDDRKVRAKFREIEVERSSAKPKLLRAVARALTTAGAVEGAFTPKYVRALGEPAQRPPDLVPAAGTLRRSASAGDAVTAMLRTDIGRVLAHDPLVRLRAEVGKGDTAVHQMRVGVRRLRSTLRTFAPLWVADWAAPLS
jgi:inorganic triphosphatase YgiF